MSHMNVSLPEALKAFVDDQVRQRGFGSSGEYLRDLLRREQERLQLRGLLLEGASSPAAAPADAGYFERLRSRVHRPASDRAAPSGSPPARS
jgi:antitoxin ParD1/3/4